jgi:AAHS family 4-hydroxybenzoate transporter-like MFS transporter
MNQSTQSAPNAVDPGRLIDEGRWSGYQKLLVAGTALTIILDGIDNQLLPNAIPTLIREWGQPRSAFTNTLAIGPFGMMLGGLVGGIVGDRFGRRPALLGSVFAFGVLTIMIAFANSIETLAALRFLAGLGLGGAMPNAATLASEYVPKRQRPLAVTLTIVSIPLGGALAGEIAALVIPSHGWRMLFAIGGLVPVVVALVFWRLLPESPKFLARHQNRWPELTRVLLRSGHRVPNDARYVSEDESAATRASGATIASLFRSGLARDTTALWAAFFFGLMVNYVIILLLPAMLTSTTVGFSQPAASRALATSNYGGVVGAVLGAFAVQRLGSRVAMLGMSLAAVASAALLAVWPLDPSHTFHLFMLILLTGGLANGVQTTMYALAAHIYPTAIRSTGVGTAVAVGRVGNVLAAYVGSLAIDRGGPTGYFMSWSILMMFVFVSLAFVKRHVPGGRQTGRSASEKGPDLR